MWWLRWNDLSHNKQIHQTDLKRIQEQGYVDGKGDLLGMVEEV